MRAAGYECAIAIIGTLTTDEIIQYESFCAQYNIEDLGTYPLPNRTKTHLVLYSLFTHSPYFVNKYSSKRLDEILQRLINQWQPTAIHFDTICLTGFSNLLQPNIKNVASVNDSYTLTLDNEISNSHLGFWRKWYKRYQLKVVRKYELKTYQKFDVVHVVSQMDADALVSIGVNTEIAVIPNGVSHLIHPQNIQNNPGDLLFVAKLGSDNLSALNQFLVQSWPGVKAANPGIRLRVVGSKTAESQKLMESLEDEQVDFLGFVADLNSAYKLGKIAVVPINKNCGIINKAVEAMAAGMVVVGFEACFTALTQARNGEHYLGGNTFQDLTAHINSVLKSPDQANKISKAAQQVAHNFYSWDTRIQAFQKLYSQPKPDNNPILVLA